MSVFEEVLESSGKPKTGLFAFLQHDEAPEVEPMRTSRASLSSHLWELEIHRVGSLDELSHEIAALAKRSLDTNCFFEPAVLTASWPRMMPAWAPEGVQFLHLYETTPKGRALRFFMPVTISGYHLTKVRALRALSHSTAPDGVPLIDAENSIEICETLFQLLGDKNLKLPGLIDFSHQRRDSRSFSTLLQAAKNLGLVTAESDSFDRAILTHQSVGLDQSISKKKRKEYARQLNRLKDKGDLTFVNASDMQSVMDEMDAFLSLEQTTWKGRRGTSLLSHSRLSAFARQMVSQMVEQDACTIYAMKLSGVTIASLIVFGKRGRYVTWKTAYAESLAEHSPGVQIMLFASRDLAARDGFEYVDSLAYADHPMIDHLWRERRTIVDLGIALNNESKPNLAKLATAKKRVSWAKRHVRDWRKRLKR